MRSFLATPLEPPESLSMLIGELAASGADLKVVDARHLHLTYKFLGEIAEEQGPQVLDAVRRRSLPSGFEVTVRDVGAFPDWRKLNVVWAGLDDPEGKLVDLAKGVEAAATELGFLAEDRPFRPHLTLARKRSDRGADRARAILSAARGRVFGTFLVGAVHLFRSTLTGKGPVYESLGSAAL